MAKHFKESPDFEDAAQAPRVEPAQPAPRRRDWDAEGADDGTFGHPTPLGPRSPSGA